MEHFVVVGAGQAGASLVARLRARGFEGAITLIGEEPVPPYQRPPLSKAYLKGEMARERLFLKPEGWYADQRITLRTGVRAEALDLGARTLRAGDEVLEWDRLALVTGSRPRPLPEDCGGGLPGSYAVRTLADIDAVRSEFGAGRRVLVVGGGYIGLEAAAVAAEAGLTVAVMELGERILQRTSAPETSDRFRALHRGHGVEVLERTAIDTLTGGDRVRGVRFAGGEEREIDFAILGMGILPNVALAEAAGIDCDGGIVVDERCETSAAGVFAAGDCAALPLRGRRMRLESVQNAIDGGEAAADAMMGGTEPYVPKPWFWSDQYDVKLQIAGLNAGYDRVVERGDGVWYYAGDRLLAVDAVNAPRDYMIGKRLIEAGKSPPPELVADPGSDLKALLTG